MNLFFLEMNNLKKRDQLIFFFSQVALWFFRDPDFMTGWAPAISPGGNGFVKVITSSLKERKIQGVPKNALSECCWSQSSYLSRIIFVEKKLSCGEIWSFYKEFVQLMEFYQSFCRFCSKSIWRKICVEKICVEDK